MTPTLAEARSAVRQAYLADESETVRRLAAEAGLDADARARIVAAGARLVQSVRDSTDPGLMESFLAEYGLSTREGIALMCLAEALLRVPDAETMDELIEDKIAPSDWGKHLGHSSSSLVNASTWALMLTGKVLGEEDTGIAGLLHGAVKRLGEPVIRTAVGQAMKEMGRQFVLGREIGEAMERGKGMEEKGYTYSYDMLGEAARTDADARRYHLSYTRAIAAIAANCGGEIQQNPGISVKLSALHPRYEYGQRDRVMRGLLARFRSLAMLAKSANMGLNIDAEEADRLDLSLDVIEEVLAEPALAGWDGFGVVVQAYGPRAGHLIDWLYALAEKHDRKIMVRLVKGAYWDTEIKRAQEMGLAGFPVFTRKTNTDISYIACARKLLGMTDRIYPQFATHNAHTVAAIMEMSGEGAFEFQRLHGMGESLHTAVKRTHNTRCRIYAPVGAHRDLLAYLVRRLLENGANSSFVNQIVNEEIAPEDVAQDPFAALGDIAENPAISKPADLYQPERVNSHGWDLTDPLEIERIDAGRLPFQTHEWQAAPMIAGPVRTANRHAIQNPARPDEIVGHVAEAAAEDVETAIEAAADGFKDWSLRSPADRAAVLARAAELYEEHAHELFALAAREAGKTLLDCVAELREAVDFLRFYGAEAMRLGGTPRGVITCISPWNFPLAIFTGQISAALAAGNAVLAKPAEQTPLIAARAVALLHEAGVPHAALQLLPGDGPGVGAPLTADPRIAGVCFTGSTEVAQRINRAMAEHMAPDAPLIAETGGLNAMMVDSTALPEQAVRDIIASAFQSAGQRCSALRMLYVQEDVADRVLEMLFGAMDELALADPWQLSTDVGPLIDADAKAGIAAHIDKMARDGRILKQIAAPAEGHFIGPTVISLGGIDDLETEIFGPVLHVATFAAHEIDQVIDRVNATGYGLTFGLHSRIDDRVSQVLGRIEAGNAYVNRNQIGAIVGSQPFGGEGLSGTGPKAGGPHYVARFLKSDAGPILVPATPVPDASELSRETLETALRKAIPPAFTPDPVSLPGPTGESNRLAALPRGTILCLGPTAEAAEDQAARARRTGNAAVIAAPGTRLDGQVPAALLAEIEGVDAVACDGDEPYLLALRQALAARPGPILQLITEHDDARYQIERHVCIDTTASGGNAQLLAASDPV
ncbi:MAG: bifunctional proline dehydrogenase/L-glutamate gamma-semialdehyde dehydrogenase PutA [Pseudomonadota bacterium]